MRLKVYLFCLLANKQAHYPLNFAAPVKRNNSGYLHRSWTEHCCKRVQLLHLISFFENLALNVSYVGGFYSHLLFLQSLSIWPFAGRQ